MLLDDRNGRRALGLTHADFAGLGALESDLLVATGGQALLEEKLQASDAGRILYPKMVESGTASSERQ